MNAEFIGKGHDFGIRSVLVSHLWYEVDERACRKTSVSKAKEAELATI